MEEHSSLVMWGGVVLLTSFMPVTALSYYKFRLPRKMEQYNEFIKSFKLEKITLSAPVVTHVPTLADYSFSVAFVTLLCFLGSFSLLLGDQYKIAETPNLLLAGTQFGDIAYQKKSLLACTMGFMGAFVWSSQYIFRRFVTLDLSPAAFFSVSIRMILASLAALMLHYSSDTLEILGSSENMLPVVAFLAGMFPMSAIHYLREKTGILSGVATRKANSLPLDMIEGMNLMHKVRLSEVGIDNAQNLAQADLPELILRTPFNLKRLVDWIGQAKLYIYFKDDIEKLRQSNIRTIFDLLTIGSDEEKLSELERETKISKQHLKTFSEIMEEDSDIKRLFQFREVLDISTNKKVDIK